MCKNRVRFLPYLSDIPYVFECLQFSLIGIIPTKTQTNNIYNKVKDKNPHAVCMSCHIFSPYFAGLFRFLPAVQG